MKIVITGGGTGGHLTIAKAFNDELYKRGIETIFIGSTKGQDRVWFADEKQFKAKYFLDTKGVIDKKGFQKLQALQKIFQATKEAKKLINDADAIISVGGFSAAPAAFAAILSKKPLFIHEQNAHIGRLNQLLKPFAKRFFCSFVPPYDPYPVQESFFQSARKREKLQTVLFLGGSQGALAINNLALKLASSLQKRGIAIIHQTGEKDYERIKKEYEERGINAEVFAFTKDLASKMHQADLAISRAGASTLWELVANNLPAIFIPYPYAAANHQFFNARFLVDKKAALCLEEKEIGSLGIETITSLELKPMSQNLASLAQKNATTKIIDELLTLLQ